MNTWFYTDKEAKQQGPVDKLTLLGLSSDGGIVASTLVWEDGMENWERWGDMASGFFPEGADVEEVALGVCAQSDRVYPVSQMLPYGQALIGADQKEHFVQHLLEKGRTGITDATVKHFEYIGFWWRCLSSFLDYLIKMVPTWICMIPYYIVVFTGGLEDLENDPSTGAIVSIAVAYGVGMIGMMAVSIFYETWMVGKYGGTLGKLIIGAKVIKPDGGKLSYKQAFVRWLAKKPLNYLLFYVPITIGVSILVGAIVAASSEAQGGATMGAAIIGGIIGCVVVSVLGSGVYWMAAFDPEKRALHDRVAATRVVKK
ncbi:MAG: RDD family protein [Verrucomicrobiales bacterium]|nr:RDD family protein [Verrucomicrobiales bacterium]